MRAIPQPAVSRWSTDDVEAPQRFDYYADALSSAIVPMRVECAAARSFRSEMTLADLGLLAVVRQRGSAHRVYRPRLDPQAAGEHSFHVIINLASPWRVEHRTRTLLQPGDAILVDAQMAFDIALDTDYEVVHLKMSDAFLRQWLPAPGALVGRRIPCDAGWGRALTSYAAQLSPQFTVAAPLPLSVITDHLGALLGLVGSQVDTARRDASRTERALSERIRDGIVQRCTEASLTPQDVAAGVSVSVRTLHRTLAADGATFGALLMAARADAAIRMLESPLFRRLTVAEIGRRSGFVDASHFSRSVRARCARTPSQIRGGQQAANAPAQEE